MHELTDNELAYIAGFVDGEGCISITKRKDKEYKNGCSFYVNLRIVNTDLEILEWIQDILNVGGCIIKRKRIGNNKQCYELKYGCLQACKGVRLLLPYIKVKKRQAKILLEFQKLKDDNHQIGRNGVPRERWMKQIKLCEEIQSLNKRGVA